MASIAKLNGKYRAQVYVNGVRRSGTFITKSEAREWSVRMETSIRASGVSVSDIQKKRKVEKSEGFFAMKKLLDGSADATEIVANSFSVGKIVGVYFLINKGKIVYVGQSRNVHARLAVHLDEKCFDSASVIPCKISELDEVELFYIRKFRPALNVTHNSDPLSDEEVRAIVEEGRV